MKKALASVFLAALVVLGLPFASDAASDSPVISVSSTSYSGQPRPYSVTVFNRLDNSKLTAKITNSGIGTRSMSCKPAGAILGLGTWRCTLGSGRLGIGSIRVTATAKSGSKSRSTTGSGSVSSRFGISSHTGSTSEGGSIVVSGSYDHISGDNMSVRARVTAGGGVVSESSCSTSGSSYTCSLRASSNIAGSSSTHTVTVTESGSAGTRSASTSVQVLGQGAPSSPSFSTSTSISAKTPQPLTIKGSTTPGLQVQLLVDPGKSRNWSSPSTSCTATGSGSWACALSQTLPTGKHTIVARTIDPSDPSRVSSESTLRFTVEKPKVVAPVPTITPTPVPVVPTPTPPAPEQVTPAKHDTKIASSLSDALEMIVLVLAVLTLALPGALTMVRRQYSASFTERNAEEEPEVEVEPVGWGDQSPTWAAFGTDATDYWSRTAPPAIAPHSPFLARLSVDGVAIRAMFGSLWWFLPIGGIALAIAAANQTGYEARPPSLGLLAAITALGCFDAFAGFVASVAFAVCVVGDLDRHGLAVVVALGFLWTSLSLIAQMLRPIRRTGAGWRYYWDRFADLVIPAIVCAWLAERLVAGMDVLAGAGTGAPANAGSVAVAVVLAIAGRVVLGQMVDLGWPERLRATQIYDELPPARAYATVLGFFVRLVFFYLVGHALIGSCWQLYAALLLLALPGLLAGLRSRSALAPMLRSGLPAGLTEILILVIWGSLLVAFMIENADGDHAKLKMAVLAGAILPGVFGLTQTLADPDAERPHTSWAMQLVGLAVVVGTTALALHGWNY